MSFQRDLENNGMNISPMDVSSSTDKMNISLQEPTQTPLMKKSRTLTKESVRSKPMRYTKKIKPTKKTLHIKTKRSQKLSLEKLTKIKNKIKTMKKTSLPQPQTQSKPRSNVDEFLKKPVFQPPVNKEPYYPKKKHPYQFNDKKRAEQILRQTAKANEEYEKKEEKTGMTREERQRQKEELWKRRRDEEAKKQEEIKRKLEQNKKGAEERERERKQREREELEERGRLNRERTKFSNFFHKEETFNNQSAEKKRAAEASIERKRAAEASIERKRAAEASAEKKQEAEIKRAAEASAEKKQEAERKRVEKERAAAAAAEKKQAATMQQQKAAEDECDTDKIKTKTKIIKAIEDSPNEIIEAKDLKKIYRKIVLTFHPDKLPSCKNTEQLGERFAFFTNIHDKLSSMLPLSKDNAIRFVSNHP